MRRVLVPGYRVGKLTLIEIVGRIPRKSGSAKKWVQWQCLCDCGNEILVTDGFLHDKLSEKNVRSCGCVSYALPETKQAWDVQWRQTKMVAADRRQLSMTLSVEEFKTLCTSPCHYCGTLPDQKMHVGRALKNGIDRIDNTKGYELGNCIPCCRVCNRMRMSLNQTTFLSQIQRIHKHLSLEP